jgi:hypothetical protein
VRQLGKSPDVGEDGFVRLGVFEWDENRMIHGRNTR